MTNKKKPSSLLNSPSRISKIKSNSPSPHSNNQSRPTSQNSIIQQNNRNTLSIFINNNPNLSVNRDLFDLILSHSTNMELNETTLRDFFQLLQQGRRNST